MIPTGHHPKFQHYQERLSVPMGGSSAILCTTTGLVLCHGYNRIVVGDRGPYVECTKQQMIHWNIDVPYDQLWRRDNPKAYYLHYESSDAMVKIYHQIKTVDYADYQIGMYYMSPFDLFLEGNVLIEPLRKR